MANQIHVGRSSLVLKYKWELSDIERRVGTTLSKMIIFRGEKLFRVGLKNEESFSTLLFMTFGAAKMGIDEAVVSIRFPNGGRERMNRYDDEVDSAQRPRRVHLYRSFSLGVLAERKAASAVYLDTPPKQRLLYT